MRRHKLFAGIVLAALYPSLVWATTLEDIEQLVEEKWTEVSSFRADLSVNVKVPIGLINVPSNAEGTVELMAHEGARKYRIDITNKIAKSFLMREGLVQEVLTVFDGAYEYTEFTAFGRTQVKKRIPETTGANEPVGGSAVFDQLRKQGDLALVGETTVDGVRAWIIDVTGNGKPVEVKGPIEPSRIRVFIAQDSGLQVRMLMFDKKNKEIMRTHYTNVQLNPKLDPTRFSYAPPPGVQVEEEKSAT